MTLESQNLNREQMLDKLWLDDADVYAELTNCLIKKINLDHQPASDEWIRYLVFDIELLANKGCIPGKVLLGNAYANGWGVKKDLKKALKFARQAASLNHPGGEVLLGFMYSNGYGVIKNYERAMKCFESALEKGHSGAMNNMGVMYEQGFGVVKNIELALKYYKQAADMGHGLAKENLQRLENNRPPK